MKNNTEVRPNSGVVNIIYNETFTTEQSYDQYGAMEYDQMGDPKMIPVCNSIFNVIDEYTEQIFFFLGRNVTFVIPSHNLITCQILMTNVETFGLKWWENYIKIRNESFDPVTDLPLDILEYINENIKPYFREKNIDEVLSE